VTAHRKAKKPATKRKPAKKARRAATKRTTTRKAKKQPQPKMGRPTVYRPEYAEQAAKLRRKGATIAEVSDFFEVSRDTIHKWRLIYDDFSDALKTPSLELDENVERSLYERAVGYTVQREKLFNHYGKIIRGTYREHIPADINAALRWLSNRQPEKWRDKPQDQGGADSIVAMLQEIADKRHAERLAQAAKPIAAIEVDKKDERS
jgi:hypothetical protein